MSVPARAANAVPRPEPTGPDATGPGATSLGAGRTGLQDRALQALFALLGLSLVFPPAGMSVVLLALAGVALLQPRTLWVWRPWRQPVVATGLALLAWIALHTLWTAGLNSPAAWSAVNKYHELLLPLLLVPLFARTPGNRAFLGGLAAGCLAYALLHWAAMGSPALADYLLPRRIAAGWTFAVSAFVFLVWAPDGARPWLWRGLAAFLVITVLVAVGGRTGHLVAVVLMALASTLLAPRGWRLALTGVVTAALLGLASLSAQVGERMQETIEAAASGPATGQTLDGQPLTSTGIRIQMLRTALDLLRAHPLAGVGYTRYAEVHADAAQRRLASEPQSAVYLHDPWIHTSNPHNEFLMLWLGAGLPALLLFLVWLGAIAWRARRAAAREASVKEAWALTGLLLAFALGCLFNSLLRDFTEGHYFAVMLSWLLARIEAA